MRRRGEQKRKEGGGMGRIGMGEGDEEKSIVYNVIYNTIIII